MLVEVLQLLLFKTSIWKQILTKIRQLVLFYLIKTIVQHNQGILPVLVAR